jgi:monoamine oxidase
MPNSKTGIQTIQNFYYFTTNKEKNMSHTAMMRSLLRVLQLARRANLEAAGAPPPISKKQWQLSRRKFLKSAAALGTLSVAPGLLSRTVFAAMGPNTTVAVVGAGLAGLNAAYQLQKAGVRAVLYEANTRVGGRVYSRSDLVAPGLVTEMGAELINTDHDDMLALADEFGLSLFDRRADVADLSVPQSVYYFVGKNWSEAELAQLLQPLVAQISNDADLLDQNWDLYAPKFDRYSVAQYLDYHADLIPLPFIRTLFENTIRTEYGAEAAESSALQLLFLLPSVDGTAVEMLGYSDETYTVEGGNGQIAESIANALGDQVQFNKKLCKLEKERHDGFKLHFSDRTHARADYVILAMPFSVLRRVEMDLPLPALLRRFINEVDLGRNEKVQAGFSQRLWRQAGFSLEAWTDLGFSEAWDGSQRQPDHTDGVLTYFLGGDEVDKANIPSDGGVAAGETFTTRLAGFIPDLEAAASGSYVGTRWTHNPYSHGAYANFKPGQLTRFGNYFWVESDVPGESQSVDVGRLVFAGEQVSDAYYGFMNGAAQTGRLAAQLVLQKMARGLVNDPKRAAVL